MTTSVRECTLRNNALLTLHHEKPKRENAILYGHRTKESQICGRIKEKTPEGTVTMIPQSTSSSSSSSSTTIATSMQVDESDKDRSERQKIAHGTDMELERLVMEAEFDRLQRYSDRSFLLQSQPRCALLPRQNCFQRLPREREREAVKDLLQPGVHSSVHVAEVFSNPGKRVFWFHPGLAMDLRTGWDLNDPVQRAKVWSHWQRKGPILIGSWSGLDTRTTHMRWMIDVYRWQVSQGRLLYMRKVDTCL